MNTFLTEHPTVAILLDNEGNVLKISTNIYPQLQVKVLYHEQFFDTVASNLQFDIVDNTKVVFES